MSISSFFACRNAKIIKSDSDAILYFFFLIFEKYSSFNSLSAALTKNNDERKLYFNILQMEAMGFLASVTGRF